MTIIPHLEMFCNDKGTVFLEVTLKSLKLGDMVQSLKDITVVELCIGIATYKLQPSIGNEHWFSSTYYKFLSPKDNQTLNVFVGSKCLVFDCGVVPYINLPSKVQVDENAL